METLTSPLLQILIEGRDVTRSLTPYLMAVTYEDALEAKADTVSITLADSGQLFASSWYPTKGSPLTVLMGYAGRVLPTGDFVVDEVEYTGPPDTLVIKGISATVTERLRTKRSRNFEGMELRNIVEDIAAQHGLTVVGDIEPNFVLERVAQHRTSDLAFLARLAAKYGYLFSVRGSTLTFTEMYALEAAEPVGKLRKNEVTRFSFSDAAHAVGGSANHRFFDPELQSLLEGNVAPVRASGRTTSRRYRAVELYGPPGELWLNFPGRRIEEAQLEGQSRREQLRQDRSTARGRSGRFVSPVGLDTEADEQDVHNSWDHVGNSSEADAAARASLHRARTRKLTARLTLPGRPELLAGMNLTLEDFGERFDGDYHIECSHHQVSASGAYVTEVELKKLRYA